MSKYHAVSSGVITKSALPSITRQRGTTTVSANVMLYGAGQTTVSNNTTFIDSSANAFTMVASGDAIQSGFNPFGQASAGAGYFDGNGDYLTVSGSSGNSAFNFGSGDVTIECWVYHTTISGIQNYYRTQSGGANSVVLFRQTNGQIEWAVYNSSGTNLLSAFSASGALTANTWNHVAAVRNGSSNTIYVNGVASGTPVTASYTAVAPPSNIYIGKSEGFAEYMSGYISNLRVVKGTAVYTSNFTPPTSPLTAITNTSLLLLTDNYSIVNSTSTNLPVTINGNTTISTAQYPTGMSSSIYFDGTGDFVTLPNNAAFDFGSGDFTIEMWIYFTATSGDLFSKRATTANYTPIIIYLTSSKIGYSGSTTGSTWDINGSFSTGTTTISTSTWAHIALVRQSGTFRSYINGVSDLVVSGVSAALMTNTTAVTIGAGGTAGSAPFQGYISNARVVKGTAVYTSNFTPPSLPMSTSVTVPAYVTNAIYGVNQIP